MIIMKIIKMTSQLALIIYLIKLNIRKRKIIVLYMHVKSCAAASIEKSSNLSKTEFKLIKTKTTIQLLLVRELKGNVAHRFAENQIFQVLKYVP